MILKIFVKFFSALYP